MSIIQKCSARTSWSFKEFSGFADTKERLDVRALDKQGNIVIIENKLDDSGRDVVWQVLKYASYCASLTNVQIKEIFRGYLRATGRKENADETLSDFLEDTDFDSKLNSGNTQRIFMVSGDFRKEVTSTVLWLSKYGLRIHCFKARPFMRSRINLSSILSRSSQLRTLGTMRSGWPIRI